MAKGLPMQTLGENIEFGSSAHLSTQLLYGRVMQQAFMMSFVQLCWGIIGIVILMIIPIFLMKMPKRLDSNVDVH